MNAKPLLLEVLEGKRVSRPPVWLMRQAGRYMKEYRELKAQHGFLGLCHSPELAVEVSMQPMREFGMDAAIIFSDIMIPTQGLGIELEFNPGPKIGNPIRSRSDVEALKTSSVNKDCHFVFEAIGSLKDNLQDKAVLGFAGSPWTLACYLIDQGIFKHFQGTLVFARRDGAAIHMLLEKLSTLVTSYLVEQGRAGADAVQIFDSWGGILSEQDYLHFSLPYIQRITEALRKENIPSILYVNGSPHLLPLLKDSGADMLSIDWRTSLDSARSILNQETSLQGNLDPTLLFLSEAEVREATLQMLSSTDVSRHYVANLGHGILPETPVENVRTFVQTVKQYA